MDLDEVLEEINWNIDNIEQGFGLASDRTDSIAAWLLLIESALNQAKTYWMASYGTGAEVVEYTEKLIDTLTLIAAMGICCLEQYTNIYGESCPWEHDFSYDKKLELDEFLIKINNMFHEANIRYYPGNEKRLRECLEELKEVIILCVSAMMQHGNKFAELDSTAI